MIFKIQNLGAVKEAEIDLSKDLILLCGHNNTGKTYVAYAVYGLVNTSFKVASSLEISAYETIKGNNISQVNEKEKVIEIDLKDQMNEIEELYLPVVKILKEQLNEIFAVKEKGLANDETNFSIKFSGEFVNSFFKKDIKSFANFHIGSGYCGDFEIGKDKDSSLFKVTQMQGFKSEKLPENETFVSYCLAYYLYTCFFTKLYLFPAERSAINIFNTELSLIKNKVLQAVLKDNSLTELAQRRVNRYPQPIRDSLELSQDLETLSKTTSPFAHLADELEEAILKGKISVGQYGDLRYSPAENPDLHLEMHVSSSLVKSLASISFYLRHIAQKGDCIIIDEPELNLHPDNQILVARFHARLVNEGFKVIASTHSDYIIREINNLIMLSKDSEKAKELRKKYEYSEKELLKHEQVGVLLFRRENPSPENLTIDETGFAIDTIDEEINKLNNKSQDIYFSLFD